MRPRAHRAGGDRRPRPPARRTSTLRAAGIRIAADDVGAGNAGLRLLSEIKFDIVKIDLSLVQGGVLQELSLAVLRGLRELAQRSGALSWPRASRRRSSSGSFAAPGHPGGAGLPARPSRRPARRRCGRPRPSSPRCRTSTRPTSRPTVRRPGRCGCRPRRGRRPADVLGVGDHRVAAAPLEEPDAPPRSWAPCCPAGSACPPPGAPSPRRASSGRATAGSAPEVEGDLLHRRS